MKKILFPISALLFATSLISPVNARAADHRRDEEPGPSALDAVTPLHEIRRVKTGMTRDQVLASMRGKPDDSFQAAVWIYWNFQGDRRPIAMERPAMMIFFTDNRVTEIRYSEEKLIRQTLAQLRQAKATGGVAAR